VRLRLEKYQTSPIPSYIARDEEGTVHQIILFDDSIADGRPKSLEGRFLDCAELAVCVEMPIKPRLVEGEL
jgi:hypothetical protein